MLAVIDTDIVAVTGLVCTGKSAELCPPATVTVEGTWACESLLCRFTTCPPDGAGPVNVTVPVAGLPPVTVFGDTVSDDKAGGGGLTLTVTDGVPGQLPALAVMFAETLVAGAVVCILNVTDVC